MPHTPSFHHKHRCPPSPSSTLNLHHPPDSTSPPPFLNTRTRHKGEPGEQQYLPKPLTGRVPPRREHMTGTAMPGTTRKTTRTMLAPSPPPPHKAARQPSPPRGSPHPEQGRYPTCCNPNTPSGLAVADSHKHTLTGYAHNHPPTRLLEEATHTQSSPPPPLPAMDPQPPQDPNNSNPPSCRSSANHAPRQTLSPPSPTWTSQLGAQHHGRRWRPTPQPQSASETTAPGPLPGTARLGEAVGDTPSSQRGYPFRGTPTRAAGHGRQRVDNSSAPNLDTDPDTQDHNHNRGPDDAFSRNVTHRGTPLHPPTPPTTTDKTQQPARNTTSAAESPPTKGGSENTGNESSKTRQHTCSPHAAPPKPRHHTTGGHSRTSNTARCRRRQQHLARLPTLRWHHPTRDNFPHQQRRHRLAPPQPRLLGSDHQTQREPGERLLFSRTAPPAHSACWTSWAPRHRTNLQPGDPWTASTPRCPRHMALHHHRSPSPR